MILKNAKNISKSKLLWRFLGESEVSESVHFFADALKTVGVVSVVELPDLHVDPLKKSADEGVVVVLHVFNVQHATENL